MTKEEIKTIIKEAGVDNNNTTKLLVLFDSKHAYSVYGKRCCGETLVIPSKIFPGPCEPLNDLPDDIEGMKVLWNTELIQKFGNIFDAMKSSSLL